MSDVLTIAVALLVIAVLSMLAGGLALSRIDQAREEHRPELERTNRKRLDKPLIFLSYRRHDLEMAQESARRLEREGWSVIRYDPNNPWDDEIELIYKTIETASAVGYLDGSSSDWIRAEIELSEKGRVPLCRRQPALPCASSRSAHPRTHWASSGVWP